MLEQRWTLGHVLVMLVLVGVSPALGADDGPAKAKIDFQTHVAPILRQHCIDCHGPAMQLADLRLDQRKLAIEEGADRGLIKAGKSADSLLIQRLVDKKLGLIMPPTFPFFPEDKVGLPESQIQVLKQWIDEGATWPEEVSLSEEQSIETPQAKALIAAIRAGERQTVDRLLADSSLVQAVDRHGATPLMHAVLYADVALLRQLIDRGADVNAADKSGATALMWAAGDLDKVKLLVERGAKVDVRSKLGRTPLLIACSYADNLEVVRFLLQSGGKITDRDLFGETLLTSASKRGAVQLVNFLLEAGADMHSGGGFVGRSPLAWAAEEGNAETVACLLEHGAAKDPKSLNSALFNAAVRGPTQAVRHLLEHGADVNLPSGFAGYTPLLGAAYSENASVDTVQLLLEKGADPHAKAATGDTALQLARKHGRTAVVAALEKAGATAPADSTPPAHGSATAQPAQVAAAAQKSLNLLQKCGPEFFRNSGCVACHQQSVTSLALAAARHRGFRVDEQTARDQVRVTARFVQGYRDRFLQRADHPINSAIASGYILMGLAAESYPPDEYTDANIIEMANRQASDGSWTAFGHRPPLEHSRVVATALAIRAIQLYSPPGLKAQLDQRVERGRNWLIAANPGANTDQAFRLLGLAWSGASQELIRDQSEALLKEQCDDGGWSQLENLDSDAYATGLTLYALHHAGGLETSQERYQRGVNYLLKTQLADGSWHVRSRSFPFQAYFESGFPHGPDQWISASATGFAAIALIESAAPAAAEHRK
jgi:ankyrin repeat protein